MKTKLVPFDIEKAKFGAKVITRAGNPVRIKHFNGKIKPYTVVAFVEEDGKERTLCFTELGQHVKCCKSKYDLFIEEEVENGSKNQNETIRKALISYFQYFPYNSLANSGLNAKDVIAWLEKHGKQETLCDKCKKSQPSHSCQDITALGRCAVEHEQKPDDNKPKFKVGDWVISEQGMVQKITNVIENVTNHTYGYDTISYSFGILSYGYFSKIVKDIRLWNITDAKDGDVLVSGEVTFIFNKIKGEWLHCYCSCHKDGSFIRDYDLMTAEYFNEVYPATIEQRELLFKKMKEAGYEWNSDKKELKKIKRHMTNQELSWWLRDCHEEHREYRYKDSNRVLPGDYYYLDDIADKEVNDVYIRRNGGEWQEPLIKIED